jgi:hypothetical protein
MVQVVLFEVKIFGPGLILVYDVVCRMLFVAKQRFPFESIYFNAEQTARTNYFLHDITRIVGFSFITGQTVKSVCGAEA